MIVVCPSLHILPLFQVLSSMEEPLPSTKRKRGEGWGFKSLSTFIMFRRYPSQRYLDYLEFCPYHMQAYELGMCQECELLDLIMQNYYFIEDMSLYEEIYENERSEDPVIELFLLGTEEWNSPKLTPEQLKKLVIMRFDGKI